MKKELLHRKGETLLIVPYWWDGGIERYHPHSSLPLLSSHPLSRHIIYFLPLPLLLPQPDSKLFSLASEIRFQRPEILSDTTFADCVPLNPPLTLSKGTLPRISLIFFPFI